jgi:CheY-like chemotaxis protein
MSSQSEVLVVEDEPVVIEAATKVLTSNDLRLDIAQDVSGALELLEERAYSLVLADLMLPGKSAFDLLKAAKNLSPQTPIILTTGYATRANAIRALRLGAFDFLPKPFDFDELEDVVQRALCFAREGRSQVDLAASEGALLDGYYFLGRHSWVRFDSQDSWDVAEIGVAETVYQTVRELRYVRLPGLGDQVAQGEVLARLEASNASRCRVLSPLSGTVMDSNLALERDPSSIRLDPFRSGWLTRVIPSNVPDELENLDVV